MASDVAQALSLPRPDSSGRLLGFQLVGAVANLRFLRSCGRKRMLADGRPEESGRGRLKSLRHVAV